MANTKYCIDYDKMGRAACKKCKLKLDKGSVRIGKVVPNPFSDGGEMKQWYHAECMFETLKKARATTKKIADPDDLEGWENIKDEDRKNILKLIKDSGFVNTAVKDTDNQSDNKTKTPPVKETQSNGTQSSEKDNSFREFRRLCARIAEEPSYNAKTNIISTFFQKGTDGDKFKGDLSLWVKMLLPGIVKRIYNLQNKQLVKLFSQIFGTDQEEMLIHLEQGDVAETIKIFFERSSSFLPAKKSLLTLEEVDNYLEELSKLTTEEEQTRVLKKIAKQCTANDLAMVIRLIKRDLRINAGAKHVLDAIHPDAYQAFQTSRNLDTILREIKGQQQNSDSNTLSSPKGLNIKASLMTPVLPMLAESCKSVEYAMKKCPNGMYAEVKYDGERVQLHKFENTFKYFSRSLKPVLPHKVEHFKDYIPQAFPHGKELILDSEVVLVDNKTGNPLPFGTLGIHKKSAFKDANVCLFVFDCLHYNGTNLMDRPIKERKGFLNKVMTEVKNRVMFSTAKLIYTPEELKEAINEAFKEGLEGLVLKDAKSVYEPGKRHWLKVKKDYLAGGAMADSADLVVLGAFYGTGKKGGMMSIFLMGCYNEATKKWCTVTKVSGGHDDETLERLQTELDMIKISKDPLKVPSWLSVTKNMIPDFVCADPKNSQVWEIVGAEFSKSSGHTADGISIRFPRVTRIRSDKTWKEATTLQELKILFEKSRKPSDTDLIESSFSSPEKKGNTSNNQNAFESDTDEEMPSPKNNSRKKTNSPNKKRKNNSELNDSPCKKPKQTIEKLFQTSNSHKQKKNEEADNPEPMDDYDDEILPNIFQGVKLYLPKDTEDYEVLKRYVIAYGGDILEEYQKSQATHWVPSKNKEESNKRGIKVPVAWLWDCIKLQRRIPTDLYKLS